MGGQKRPLDIAGLTIPTHVAIVMDGSGRWAARQGLSRQNGYAAGVENLGDVIDACVEFGIKILTVYAFSEENGSQSGSEVSGLIRAFLGELDQVSPRLNALGVCIHCLGDLAAIDPTLRKKLIDALELTKDNDHLVLNVAFNNAGRAEIVHAVRQMLSDSISPEELSEELFGSYLFTDGLTDPDLVIRTSAEFQVSDFLIWQAAYAEFYPAGKDWPDFGRDELHEALVAFSRRDRRFGLVADP
jgi:undecaprenyl diphosphate synthase